jgi:hypothetical protein
VGKRVGFITTTIQLISFTPLLVADFNPRPAEIFLVGRAIFQGQKKATPQDKPFTPFTFRVGFLIELCLNPMPQAVLGFFLSLFLNAQRKNPPALAEWGIEAEFQHVS